MTQYRSSSWRTKALTVSGTLTGQALFDISGASAGQIKFPATQNPSADANTLDDYEEGTWTPTDTSGAGLTFTTPSGTYIKVGSLVSITGQVIYPITASGSGTQIGALPFTTKNVTDQSGYVPYADVGTAITCLLRPNTTTLSFWDVAGIVKTNVNLSTKNPYFGASYST